MNNAQTVVNQASQQTSVIAEGAGLNLAFKSEPGQVILASILDRFADKLERLIVDDLSEAQAIQLWYELRGTVSLCDDLGDAIRQATHLVAKTTIQDKLRQQRRGGGV